MFFTLIVGGAGFVAGRHWDKVQAWMKSLGE